MSFLKSVVLSPVKSLTSMVRLSPAFPPTGLLHTDFISFPLLLHRPIFPSPFSCYLFTSSFPAAALVALTVCLVINGKPLLVCIYTDSFWFNMQLISFESIINLYFYVGTTLKRRSQFTWTLASETLVFDCFTAVEVESIDGDQVPATPSPLCNGQLFDGS